MVTDIDVDAKTLQRGDRRNKDWARTGCSIAEQASITRH